MTCLAHRIALDPTVEQRIALSRAAGCARFAWNWALAEWDKQYKAGAKPSANSLKKQFNALKHKEFPWIAESPKDANQQPFTNLGNAFKRFFKKTASRPRFKKKGVKESFYISNDKFTLGKGAAKLSSLGYYRLMEPLRFSGKIMAGSVFREADRWYLSVVVDVGEVKRERTANGEVGIDLGISTALQLSDGTAFHAPKPLKRYLNTLRQRARALSRKVKGSANRAKAAIKLAKLHSRIKNVRNDWTHKVTTQILRENQTVCLEDLNVKGMAANHKLARAISDIGFYEIRRQLTYKAPLYGSRVVVINRWLPTSKTCSNCGCKKESIALSERTFTCEHCGASLDRDLNAAKNILAAGLAVSACGEESSDGCALVARETSLCEAGTTPRRRTTALTK